MKTYWDYTDREQADMTSEQVESILTTELMTHGVLKPTAPVLQEVPKCPVGERQKFFSVTTKGKYGSSESLGVVFKTMDDAVAFSKLNPVRSDYDYEVGSDFKYAMPVGDFSFEEVELYTLDQINAHRSQLKKNAAMTEANETALSKFKEASRKAEDITSKVWTDWHNKRETKYELHKVVETFSEYQKIAGDSAVAWTFLEKAFNADKISEACQWFPDEIQRPEPKVEAAV